MEKYQPGETVYAIAHPTVKLTVRRYVSRIYYCRVQSNPALKELVYFERELCSDNHPPTIDIANDN